MIRLLWLWCLATASGLAVATATEVAIVSVADPPNVDGVLDDAVWDRVQPVSSFRRFNPSPGGAPKGTTEVRFLQDEGTLYVAVKVRDAGYPIRARVSRREAINADDQIGLYLDPYNDAQTGYIFYFNALGIQQDIRFNAGEWIPSWNTVYRSRGQVVEDGFDLEIAIPFRSLKYPAPKEGEAQTWGLMITRKIPSEGYKYGFPLMQNNHPSIFAQAAPLVGVRPPSTGSGVDLVAGLTARVEGTRESVTDPMVWSDADPWTEVVTPSVDARFGLSPNIGVAATVNPDFSEVEADITPVVLNQRFAFRFPERRQFFTEGDGFFRDQENTLYSRSIVRPVEGLKVTGREGKWSLGVLQSIDQQPGASVNENGTPGFNEEDVEGRWASNAMARVRHDLLGTGYVGITMADKRLMPSPYVPPDPKRDPTNAGVDQLGFDARVPLGGRWFLNGSTHHTLLSGEAFLYGSSNLVTLSRSTGSGAGLTIGVGDTTPGFRPEMGFLPQTGLTNSRIYADYTVNSEGALTQWVPSITASALTERNGDFVVAGSHRERFVIRGVHAVELVAGGGYRREIGDDGAADVPEWWVGASYAGQIGSALVVEPEVSAGQTMDFSTLRPANQFGGELNTTLRLSGLRADLLLRHNQFIPQAGSPEASQWQMDNLVRLKVHWQFTRTLGVRIIESFSAVSEQDPVLTTSLLATWQLHPFTSAHIGYAEETLLGRPWGATARSVFAKIQVLIPQ